MEWEDLLCYSPLDESFCNSNGSASLVWSFEEKKVFEKVMADQVEALGSPAFFQNLATKLPTKSMQDIKVHFEALVRGVEVFESGSVPISGYDRHSAKWELMQEHACERDKRSRPVERKTASSSRVQRRKGVPWTAEEHQLFLMGLNKYGKGDWKSISRYYVMSKTPTQVASHAQKYFKRQMSTTPMDKRRPSIHDIQTVRSAITTAAFAFDTSSVQAPKQPQWIPTITDKSIDQRPSTLMYADQFQSPIQLQRAENFLNNPMNGYQGMPTFNNSFLNGAYINHGQNPSMFPNHIRPPMQHLGTATLMNNYMRNGNTCPLQNPNALPLHKRY